MDLQTIRERIQRKGYTGREDFLADVALIEANSKLYNGPDDMLTLYASKLLEHVCLRFSENEETLMHLEKAINPLLDDNDQGLGALSRIIITKKDINIMSSILQCLNPTQPEQNLNASFRSTNYFTSQSF